MNPGKDKTVRDTPPDVAAYNRDAWNRQVRKENPWTVPVTAEQIAAARRGEWQVVLTPQKPVPREWFGELAGARVLCLASGGGQQGPILAAAGAKVTVFDNSPAQLAQDLVVASRDQLDLEVELGVMQDLSRFADATFDLVFHPVSNVFVPDVRPVWREAARVLRSGGALLAGFASPALFLFDHAAEQRGELIVRYKIPYSDLTSLTGDERERRLASGEPLAFGHTLQDQIGGQLDAGFVITGFYEDGAPDQLLDQYLLPYLATRAGKSC